MSASRNILKLMVYGAVLSGTTGMFVCAGPPQEMRYGLIFGALVGVLLGIGFGMVRLFKLKPTTEDSRFEKETTFWKLLSDNQRFAFQVGLLVFGLGGLLFVLSEAVIIVNMPVSTRSAVAFLCLGMLSLCVACILAVTRVRSAKKRKKRIANPWCRSG